MRHAENGELLTLNYFVVEPHITSEQTDQPAAAASHDATSASPVSGSLLPA